MREVENDLFQAVFVNVAIETSVNKDMVLNGRRELVNDSVILSYCFD